MGDYQPIYSYQRPSRSVRRNHPPRRFGTLFSLLGDDRDHVRCLPLAVAILVVVAFSTVLFLSIGEVSSIRHPWSPSARPPTAQGYTAPSSPHDPAPGFAPGKMSAPSFATDSLNAYLHDAKTFALQRLTVADTSNAAPLTIIMGNEAGDLDSAASAISLSYLLTRFGAPPGYSLPKSVYVPLIQSNHDDAVLRPENTAAFAAARVDPTQLIFLDDVRNKLGLSLDAAAFSPAAGVSIGLVDHPSLTGPWGGARASDRKVTIVVDHHEDVGDHADAPLRIVKSPSKEPVGSASSLIALLFKDELIAGKAPKEVADLLISAIVIDTDNLRPAPRGKATQTDFDAVKLLLPISSFAYPELSQQVQLTAFQNSPLNMSQSTTAAAAVEEPVLSPPASADVTDKAIVDAKAKLRPFWEVLMKSKLMVSHLGGRDLLRRDYKEMDFSEPSASGAATSSISLRLGFASVPISIAEWLHKDRPYPSLSDAPDPAAEVDRAWDEWWTTLDAFMEERKIDLAVVTGSFRVAEGEEHAGKHKRELVLAWSPRGLGESQAEALWTSLRDGLERDAHVAADEVERRLMLEQPWKGQRLPESAGGKRERVAGVDRQGRRTSGTVARWAKVYKQANARANRKIVLPAVVAVLKSAVARL